MLFDHFQTSLQPFTEAFSSPRLWRQCSTLLTGTSTMLPCLPPPPKKNYVKYYYATVMNCQVRKSTGNFTIHGGGRKRKLKRKTACSHLPTLPNKSIWEPSPLIQPEAWAKVIINVQENVHRTAGKQLCPIIQAASWRVRVKMVQLFLYTPEKHMVELRYRSSHS